MDSEQEKKVKKNQIYEYSYIKLEDNSTMDQTF
jgi:hypothetical protein